MAKLSHKPAGKPARKRAATSARASSRLRPRPATPPTVADALYRGARRLARAGVFFGHGTDNAGDEAAALLWSTLGLPWPITAAALRRRLRPADLLRYEALLQQRIDTRLPSAYLTGETFFAGLPMRVDPRALVPRSPLAELIERQFRPWIDPARVRHILDLCTGGGCIALACAHHLPRARVEGTDISRDALALARENRRRLGLYRRVRLTESDHFSALGGRRYDIIVSNPPYVGAAEMRSLPPEYGYEPRLGLAAGREGLDSVRVILKEAARHLTPVGVLVVEVGNTETAVRRRWPRLPFTWLGFERG
ncbi:MAG: 50S ribosomal protein L3 N(5)-glutamine methyltransferase, partial [Gammaproteobacteria bacterium]